MFHVVIQNSFIQTITLYLNQLMTNAYMRQHPFSDWNELMFFYV